MSLTAADAGKPDFERFTVTLCGRAGEGAESPDTGGDFFRTFCPVNRAFGLKDLVSVGHAFSGLSRCHQPGRTRKGVSDHPGAELRELFRQSL